MASLTLVGRALKFKFLPLFKPGTLIDQPSLPKSLNFKSLQFRPCRACSTNTNTNSAPVTPTNSTNAADEFKKYSVTEVKIPVPGGVLAGKLWEPLNPALASSSGTTPPIICVHGWLDNAASFDALIPLLMNNSTTFFAFDLPGHGFTTYCPLWFYDAHVEGVLAVERVLRHFGWEKASYLGHSMGGIIGFVFTSFFPDRVHKLVALENIRPLQQYPLIAVLKSSFDLVFAVEEREKLSRKSYPFEVLVKKFREGRQNTVSEKGCRILLKRGAVQVEDGKDGYRYSYNFRTLIPGQEGRFTPKITGHMAAFVKSPVCFIKAEGGNVYETKLEMDAFVHCLEGSLGPEKVERHSAPGSHHFHLDNPQPVADIIKKFLEL